MQPNEMFYVVLRDDDFRLFRHPRIEGDDPAGREALRLAHLNPNHKFYVLKVCRVAETVEPPPPPPPKQTRLRSIDVPNSAKSPLVRDRDIPF